MISALQNINENPIIEENDYEIIPSFEGSDQEYLEKRCWKCKNQKEPKKKKKKFYESRNILVKPFRLFKDLEGNFCLQNTHYTGIIQLKNIRVHFSTKIRTHIFYMLSYMKTDEELLFDPDKIIDIEEGEEVFDFLGRLFLTELNKIMKVGLLKRYIEVQDNIGYVKGKLSIKGQLQNDIDHIQKFSCKYHDLTFDNLENRVVLRAIDKIIPIISNKKLKKDLKRHNYIIRDFIKLMKNISSIDCNRISFNRLNSYYYTIVKLSRLILDDNFVRSTQKGKSKIFNFLVNTQYLYENFLSEILKEVVEEEFNNYEVEIKMQFKDLFVEDDGPSIQPDIVLKINKSYPIIIDAKYKLKELNPDYYEMIAYTLADGKGKKSGCIIFPSNEESFIEDKSYTLSKFKDIKIYIFSIDLYEKEDLDYEEFIKRIKNRIKEILIKVISSLDETSDSEIEQDTIDEKSEQNDIGSITEDGIKIFNNYEGKLYEAIYFHYNKILFNGKIFESPTAACRAIVKWVSCNGWEFWKFNIDGNEYILTELRSKKFIKKVHPAEITYDDVIDAIRNKKSFCPIHTDHMCIQTLSKENHNWIKDANEKGVVKYSEDSQSGKDILIPKAGFDAFIQKLNSGRIINIDPRYSPYGSNSVFIGAILARTLPDKIIVIV